MTLAALGQDDTVAWPDDAIEVGRILGPWGVKGWFKVQAFAAEPEALFSSKRWFLQPAQPRPGVAVRPGAAATLPRLLKITQAREHGEGIVATAQEVPGREAAEALKGARIFVSRGSFPTASKDEFYWVDLIGLSVVNRDGALLGEVTDLLDTGPHCVLRIRRPDAAPDAPPDEAERLVPFVDAYIDEVNLAEKRITVDWGLDF